MHLSCVLKNYKKSWLPCERNSRYDLRYGEFLKITIILFKEFEDTQVELASKDKGKQKGDGETKVDKKYAPYWFENG